MYRIAAKMARKPNVKSLEREFTRKFNDMMKFVLEEMLQLAISEANKDAQPTRELTDYVLNASEAVNEAGLAVQEAFDAIKEKVDD